MDQAKNHLPDDSSKISEVSSGKLPPISEMKLNRSHFRRDVPMIFVGLQCDKNLKSSVEKLRPLFPHFIRFPKVSRTYLDSNGTLRKLMLVQMPETDRILQWMTDLKQWNIDLPEDYSSPASIDLTASLPESLNDERAMSPLDNDMDKTTCTTENEASLFDKTVHSPCLVNISVGYEQFTFEQVIKELLPDSALPVTGFTVIGHIVQFNLKHEALPFRHIIGQVALDKIPNIRTVIHKVSIIDKVYWNPRLGTEHTRVISSLRPPLTISDPFITPRPMPGDRVVVYDVFAGVGPFSIPAGRAGCHVLANDLNPDSFDWLKKNVTQNSSRKHPLKNITCYNMDGREFIREILLPHYRKYGNHKVTSSTDCDALPLSIDRFVVIMNLPQLAIDFLDSFVPPHCKESSVPAVGANFPDDIESYPTVQKFLKPLYMYCYCFMRRNIESEQTVQMRVAEALNTDFVNLFHLATPSNDDNAVGDMKLTGNEKTCVVKHWNLRYVRNVAPFKDMYCAEFELYLPKQWLLYDHSVPAAKRSRNIEN
ncbi:unnamed protein product [Heterobilharzia americana]|nr:unnamed protein product [Heterobilharzia americana]